MRGIAVATAVLLAGGCASTTYDASLATSTPGPTTTTTLPSGPATVLLPRMLAAAQSLSGVISSRGDDVALAEQVADDWTATRDEVDRTRPELVPGFDDAVRVLTSAARLDRPADADKAAKNLKVLIDAYLGT